MDKLIKIITAVLVAALMAVPPAWPAPSAQVLGTAEKLPNGLIWLFSPQTGLPLVTLQLLVKAGTLQDPPGKAGLANLAAVLLLSGTKQRQAAEIAQQLDFLGAKLGAQGGDDFATLSLTVLKKDLEAGLDLMQDVLLHPAYAQEEMRRKVAQFQAALKSEEDEPGVVAVRNFNREIFGDFPYGHPVRGTHADLAAIARKDLVEFHQRYYRPGNAILCVVGDLDAAEARRHVEKFFSPWKDGSVPATKLPAIPSLNETRVVVIDREVSQANIILGSMGLARSNPDFYAVQVMNYILGGGGFASRLLDNIRENRGLAYSVRSSFEAGLEPGPFAAVLETKNASASEAVNQVLAEMKRMRNEPVTAQELQDARSFLIGSFPRKMDSMGKRAGLMSYVQFYGLGLDYPWRYPQLIQNLTPADIQRVAQKYLHPDKYLLVVVGKKSEMPPPFGIASRPGGEEKKDAQKKPQS